MTIPKEHIGDRIAKVIARAGVCSRREAERKIEAGAVSVNGEVLDTPAYKVSTDDQITVDGQPLPTIKQSKLWRYHKPVGEVTTHDDPQGRSTVFDGLDSIDREHIISVGRLDLNSEGLLLLTNDGELARTLEHPKNEISRTYRVRVYGNLNPLALAGLKNGSMVDGVKYGSIEVEIDNKESSGRNHWLTVTLQEGKNREIRKVMAHLRLQVNRLIRVSYGPFELGSLPTGKVEAIPEEQLNKFKAKDTGK